MLACRYEGEGDVYDEADQYYTVKKALDYPCLRCISDLETMHRIVYKYTLLKEKKDLRDEDGKIVPFRSFTPHQAGPSSE
jgi:uncharacterized metal-binding protein YceD (DUF177 family)